MERRRLSTFPPTCLDCVSFLVGRGHDALSRCGLAERGSLGVDGLMIDA